MDREELTRRDGVADSEDVLRRRLEQCEAAIAQLTTGVAVLEPYGSSAPGLRLVMMNDVAANYYGSILSHQDFEAAEAGMRASGLFDIALLVSVTGQSHFQERVPVPGAAAAGHVVDLSVTPLDDGAVTVVFEDVTLRSRQSEAS